MNHRILIGPGLSNALGIERIGVDVGEVEPILGALGEANRDQAHTTANGTSGTNEVHEVDGGRATMLGTTQDIDRGRFRSADACSIIRGRLKGGKYCRTCGLTELPDSARHSGPERSLVSVVYAFLRDRNIAVSGNLEAVHLRFRDSDEIL